MQRNGASRFKENTYYVTNVWEKFTFREPFKIPYICETECKFLREFNPLKWIWGLFDTPKKGTRLQIIASEQKSGMV